MNISRVAVVTDAMDRRGNPTNGLRVWRAMVRMGLDAWLVGHDQVETEAFEGADLVLALGTILYPDNLPQVDMIADIKPEATPLAFWYFDACNPRWQHSAFKHECLCKIAPSLDWLFTTDRSWPWENVVRHYGWLMQGVDPDDFKAEPEWSGERALDVIFTGHVAGEFAYRQDLLARLAAHCSVAVYGPNSGERVYGQDFVAAHNRARVALVPAPPAAVADHYWSNRIYMAAATGTPCVVGLVPGIENHYRNLSEVIYYETPDEMLDAVRALLRDGDVRRRMGEAARERTLREHTYEARVRQMLGMIEAGGGR